MFPNESQSRSKIIDLEKFDAKTRASSTRVLLAQFNEKLNNGFKDNLTKSVARLFQTSKTQTSPNENNVRIHHNSYDDNKQIKRNKSNIDRSTSSSTSACCRKINCTAINDNNINGESRIWRATQVANERHLRSRGDSIASQPNWMPSIKNSLQRSWSLQAKKFERRPSISRLGRRDKRQGISNGARVGHDSKIQYGLVEANGKRLKCAISQRVNNYDSWLKTGNGKIDLAAAIFILINLLLPLAITYAAPLPPPTPQIQPIWFHDGLITLDPNQIESDFYAQALDGELVQEPGDNFRDDQPNQLLDQVLAQVGLTNNGQQTSISLSRSAQPLVPYGDNEERVRFGRRDTPNSQDRPIKSTDELEQILADSSEKICDELLEIQRRRLERDRALEPPPWLREQPMRRGYNPLISQKQEDHVVSENTEKDRTGVNEGAQQSRPARGRQSRELADQIYEELLGHILEGALDDQKIVDNLYEELQEKLRTNRPPKLTSQQVQQQQHQQQQQQKQPLVATGLQSTINDGSQQEQLLLNQQQQQQIDAQRSGQALSGSHMSSLQESEPDSTLVVVGDEVSSEDNVSSENVDKHSPITSLQYTLQGSSQNTYGDGGNEKLLASSESTNPSSVASDGATIINVVSPTGQIISTRPINNLRPSLSGIDLLSVDPVEKQQIGYEVNEPNSFHVLEDIDKEDTVSQSSPNQEFGGNSKHQQQQQFVEPSDWLGGQSVESERPISSGNSMKRAAPSVDAITGQVVEEEMGSVSSAFGDSRIKSNQQLPRNDLKSRLAIMLIESGYIGRDQLIEAATKLKTYLEEMIGIPKGSILGLYPLNGNQLLARLNISRLDYDQMLNMIKNYDFARGFILVNWPNGSHESPLPILSAISRVLNSKYGSDGSGNNNLASTEPAEDGGVDGRPEALVRSALPAGEQQLSAAGVSAAAAAELMGEELAASNSLNFDSQREQPEEELTLLQGSQYLPANYKSSGGRLALPALGAYLSALVAQERLRSRAFANAAWRFSSESERLDLPAAAIAYLGGPLPLASGAAVDEHMLAARVNREKSADGGGLRSLQTIHWLALAAALLGASLAVKLLMRGAGTQIMRRRFSQVGSIWSRSGQSHSSSVSGPGDKQSELKEANLDGQQQRRQRGDNFAGPADDVEPADKAMAYNLDVLTQRLLHLISHRPFGKMAARESPPPNYEEANDSKELDEASALDEPASQSASNQGGHPNESSRFRSSGSYIRSLIDVLSKARAQVDSSGGRRLGGGIDTDELSSLADEEISAALLSRTSNLAGTASEADGVSAELAAASKQPDAGIVMSQMDISAAHLILAYMEKHLEDKERLRREWLELNAGPTRGTSAKIVQLMLQRLAKVALNDENRHKNRNCLVVPFDRNRVKLGTLSGSTSSSGQTGQQQPAVATSAAGKQTTCKNGAAADAAPRKSADYINASYIYDDDLRRPTHIIAQGPTKQTCGQFWQMIWEQGISVVVMLTRLNENSVRMCYCYWPTNSGLQDTPAGGGGQATAATAPSTCSRPTTDEAREKDGPVGAKPERKPSGGPTELSSSPDNTGNGQAVVAAGNGAPSSNGNANSNGRRLSVTSVFNTVGARLNPNGQPIIANGDLSNNILYFDLPANGKDSFDEDTGAKEVEQTNQVGKSTSGKPTYRKNYNSPAKTASSIRFEVHLVSEHVSSSDYLVRNLYLVNRSTGETRTITQFHYLSWPENGVPDNVKSFLQFRRKVHKSYRNLKSPILVHCSDGGGRSGTYTLIDIILERIKNGAKEIDPRATLEHLRDQRVGLCGTQSQFEFVLVALAEEIQIILNALPQ